MMVAHAPVGAPYVDAFQLRLRRFAGAGGRDWLVLRHPHHLPYSSAGQEDDLYNP